MEADESEDRQVFTAERGATITLAEHVEALTQANQAAIRQQTTDPVPRLRVPTRMDPEQARES